MFYSSRHKPAGHKLVTAGSWEVVSSCRAVLNQPAIAATSARDLVSFKTKFRGVVGWIL